MWLALVFCGIMVFQSHSISRCFSCRNFVCIFYDYSEAAIKRLAKAAQEVNLRINEGILVMGIHYDYKSTRMI